MSQPANNNNSMAITLQLQMVNAINQQTALFQSMNTILSTLNNGFNALTQAIRKNTEVMLKLAVGPRVGMANILSGAMPKSAGTTQKFADIDAMLMAAFTPLQQLGKIVPPALLSASGLGGEKKSGNYQTELFDALKGIFAAPFSALSAPTSMYKNSSGLLAKSAFTLPSDGLGGLFQGGKEIFKGLGMKIGNLFSSSTMDSVIGSEWMKSGASKIGGVFKGGFQQAGSLAKPFVSALGAMGPQMAAMALVMEPVMAFLGGLLEPFSMITDMFAAFGEILGTAFIPVLQESVMPLLTSLLPIFSMLATALAPVIQLLFSLTGIGILTTVLSTFLPILTPIINVLMQLVTIAASFLVAFMPLLDLIMIPLTVVLNTIANGFSLLSPYLTTAMEWISSFTEGIKTFIETLKTFSWNDIGTMVTGGGADKYGWW